MRIERFWPTSERRVISLVLMLLVSGCGPNGTKEKLAPWLESRSPGLSREELREELAASRASIGGADPGILAQTAESGWPAGTREEVFKEVLGRLDYDVEKLTREEIRRAYLFYKRAADNPLFSRIERVVIGPAAREGPQSFGAGAENADLELESWQPELIEGTGITLLTSKLRDLEAKVRLYISRGESWGYFSGYGQASLILPTGAGDHALVDIDRESLPPDSPDDVGEVPAVNEFDDLPCVDPDPAIPATTIKTLLLHTAAARKAMAAMRLPIFIHLNEARQVVDDSFDKSGVAIKMEWETPKLPIVVDESKYASQSELVDDLAAGIGAFSSVPALRDRHEADLVVLVVAKADACGWARGIGVGSEDAFASVHVQCAGAEKTLAHEIGHLMGARHDAHFDSINDPFPYQHGFVFRHGHWSFHTIMGLKPLEGPSDRLPRWSNPRKPIMERLGGVPGLSDNACVLNQKAGVVARFR